MRIESEFKPAWWLNNPHLQTIWAALLRQTPAPPVRRERVPTPDGDFYDLDWYGPEDAAIVILLHGLTGSSRSGYIRGLQHAFDEIGLRTVAFNFRGCSGQPNRRAPSYHSGDTTDLDDLYRRLRRRFPGRPLAAVGFSLGGNVLLKWLGESPSPPELFAAVAVSVPFELSLCASHMDRGLSRLYRDRMLANLKRAIIVKQAYLESRGLIAEAAALGELGDLSRLRSFWDYDSAVIARLHAFRDAGDYYRRASSRQFLPHIAAPTLMIQARDDPFMGEGVIPDDSELSSSSVLELTAAGGHVGFISGTNPAQPEYWLDRRIPAFLRQNLPAGWQR